MDNLGPSERVLSIQNGVFRTNCIDCLDRTNVVQSMLAHRILELQMQVMALSGKDSTKDCSGDLYECITPSSFLYTCLHTNTYHTYTLHKHARAVGVAVRCACSWRQARDQE